MIKKEEINKAQINIRTDEEFRDRLKIMSIKRKKPMNDLVMEYLTKCLEKDENR